MNLLVVAFERRQIPHGEIAKRFPRRVVDEIFRRDRTKETELPVWLPHPAWMIHVGGESPTGGGSRFASIMREQVAELIAFHAYVRALLELRKNLVAHRLLVKRRGRLLEQGPREIEKFPPFHRSTRRRGYFGQRDVFSFMQHDRLGPTQEPPPFPGRSGDNQKNEG